MRNLAWITFASGFTFLSSGSSCVWAAIRQGMPIFFIYTPFGKIVRIGVEVLSGFLNYIVIRLPEFLSDSILSILLPLP